MLLRVDRQDRTSICCADESHNLVPFFARGICATPKKTTRQATGWGPFFQELLFARRVSLMNSLFYWERLSRYGNVRLRKVGCLPSEGDLIRWVPDLLG